MNLPPSLTPNSILPPGGVPGDPQSPEDLKRSRMLTLVVIFVVIDALIALGVVGFIVWYR